MKLKDIVVIQNGVPVAGTWLIAQGFEREHKTVINLIEKYRADFEDFSLLESKKYCSTGGRPVVEYLLDEEQTAFLGTLLRNNSQSVKFKKSLIKEFYRMKDFIIRAKAQHKDPKWIETRQAGKPIRLEATDAMKEFETYAIEQGSEHADTYYINITKMMNSLLFIVNGTFKNLRDLMTARQLMTVSSAEQIIDKALKDGMRKKIYYKDIYRLVKERVQLFADLHGQSEVISNQLLLFDNNHLEPTNKGGA